jgi:hypothetical protein
MKYSDIKKELLEIVGNQKGKFISAYQICNILEETHPQIWVTLRDAYPSPEGHPTMGAGANKQYSPATFVAQALENFRVKDPSIRKEYFTCENIEFNGTKPGFTGNIVSIWAIQN